MGDAEIVGLLELATALINNDHPKGSGTVMLSSDEHNAKVQNHLASPKSPEQNNPYNSVDGQFLEIGRKSDKVRKETDPTSCTSHT